MNIYSKPAEKSPQFDEARNLCDDPATFFDHSKTKMQTISRDRLAGLHLEGLRYRFAALRDRIPMLRKLADKQAIQAIKTIDDIVPLLFEHTMYKSYRASLLEQNNFTEINRWLSKLTTIDLTQVDVSHCRGIDDWLATIERETPLMLCHSSGTSGTFSFLPSSKAEWKINAETIKIIYMQDFGKEKSTGADEEIFYVHPYFSDGGNAALHSVRMMAQEITGSLDRLYAAYPERLSSDVLYLAGRMRAAEARGERDRVQVSEDMLRRKDEFEQQQRDMPAHLQTFFDRIIAELGGKRVFFAGTFTILYDLAQKGLANGLENVFAENSIVVTGGGGKGVVLPDSWQEEVRRFAGVRELKMAYAMSEVFGTHEMCEHGHYHFAPWVVPFVLDPDDGEVLPRRGTVTGRAAFFDLGSKTRWGGFITGDEVTVNWDEPCACGRTSHYTQGAITRFSDKNGGDDKITCAATFTARQEAMDFLTGMQ